MPWVLLDSQTEESNCGDKSPSSFKTQMASTRSRSTSDFSAVETSSWDGSRLTSLATRSMPSRNASRCCSEMNAENCVRYTTPTFPTGALILDRTLTN
jgi:hypothetical protein